MGEIAGRRGRRGRAAALSPRLAGFDCCGCIPYETVTGQGPLVLLGLDGTRMRNTNPDAWFKWRLETNSYAGMQKGGWHTNYWEEGRRTKEEKSLAEQEVRRTCTQSREINKKKLD